MVIRPLVAANILGEIGRPAVKGASGGSASFYPVGDTVSLGRGQKGAKLYSAPTLFKMTGAVELISEDFSDTPVLF